MLFRLSTVSIIDLHSSYKDKCLYVDITPYVTLSKSSFLIKFYITLFVFVRCDIYTSYKKLVDYKYLPLLCLRVSVVYNIPQ